MHTPDFSRQLKVAGMTSAAQEALARARVIIFGAGGLAATAAPWLAAAGVGHLTIVDADTIAASNLHRQTPYTYADLGAKKSDNTRRLLPGTDGRRRTMRGHRADA